MSDFEYPNGCKPINLNANNNELIQRLKILADTLYGVPPIGDGEDRTQYLKLFRHLSNQKFLDNSNSDVQLSLAICLANILLLFKSELPTTNPLQLKEVYFLLFRALKGLGETTTDTPKFRKYDRLADHLKNIMSPVAEIKNADDREGTELVRQIIKTILTIPCGKGFSKNARKAGKERVYEKNVDEEEEGEDSPMRDDEEEEDKMERIMGYLSEIAVKTLQEIDFIPNQILDVIFFYLTEPQRTHYPETYFVAQNIIRKAKMQLEPAIKNVLHTSVMTGELSEDFEMTGSGSRVKFYDLLRALHHIGNDLVTTTLPFLARWMQAENVADREQTVRIIGLMTKEKNCHFGLSEDDVTWKAFLNSSFDEAPPVRSEFTRQSKNVLISNHSHLRGSITNCLIHLTKDIEEDIRELVVVVVTEIAKFKLEAVSDRLLKACAERMRDKKGKVRTTTVKCMMALYHHVMTSSPLQHNGLVSDASSMMGASSSTSGITNGNIYTNSDRECVEFIPNAVFLIYRAAQKSPAFEDARLTIERYFQLYFVPYKIEVKQRMELMAHLFRKLDELGVLAFADILNRSSQIRRSLIAICNDISSSTSSANNEEGKKPTQLKERIRKLSSVFKDPNLLERILMGFVNQIAEDEKTFEMIKYLISDDYTTAEMITTAHQLILRAQERKTVLTSQQTHVVTFRRFIDRCTPLLIDSEGAKVLTDLVSSTVIGLEQKKKISEENVGRDLALFKIWTDNFAHLFTSEEIIEKIVKNILSAEDSTAVEIALDSLSSILSKTSFRSRLQTEEVEKTKWFLRLKRDLIELLTRKEAKYRRSVKLATRLLTWLVGKQKAVEIYDNLIEELIKGANIENEGCANSFQVLAEIVNANPNKYLDRMLEITNSEKIGKEILLSPIANENDPKEFNASISLEKQPWPKYTIAKVYAAKFAVKIFERSFEFLSNAEINEKVLKSVKKLINSLSEIIEYRGELKKNSEQSEVEKVRLRAAAGACILKLCTFWVYRAHVDTELFKNLSYLIADEALCVRKFYANHVKKLLGRKLPIDFAACFGLVNLGIQADDETVKQSDLDSFKTLCLCWATMAFRARTEEAADKLGLVGGDRTMFCAETVIAYTVWLLANYDSFRSVNDVNLLAEMQECIWLIIDALRNAKCNLQKVYKTFEMIKKYGDRPKRDNSKISEKNLFEHNKKMWALSDLGISMMLYRAKVQMNDEYKEPGVNRQFFYACTDKADPSEVYAPDVLIDDEKQRNGKLPKGVRAFNQTMTSSSSLSSTSKSTLNATRGKTKGKRGGGGGGKTRGRGRKANSSAIFENDDEDDEEIQIDDSDTETTTNRERRRKNKPKGVYDIPEGEEEEEEEAEKEKEDKEEEDDDDEEEAEKKETNALPRRRGRPSLTTKTSNGTKTNGTPTKKKGKKIENEKEDEESIEEISSSSETLSAKKRGRRGKSKEKNEEEEEEEKESLDQLLLSPIVEDGKMGRRSKRTAKITSSTPLRIEETKSRGKRKMASENVEEAEENSTKRRSSKKEVEKKPTTGKTRGRPKAKAASPKKSLPKRKKLEKEDEDEEEQQEEEHEEEEEEENSSQIETPKRGRQGLRSRAAKKK